MAQKTIDLKAVLFGEILSACQQYGIKVSMEDSVVSLFRKVVAHWDPEKVAVFVRDAGKVKDGLLGELNQVIKNRFDELEKEKAAGAATLAAMKL